MRTSIPDISLSELADPPRLALVQAFRDEVAAAVRAAEFSDLRGLIQGLSTGVQAALEKIQAGAARQPATAVSDRRVVRLAPRPPFLAGREDVLAELVARLGGGDGPGPRVVALHGLAGAGKTPVALAYAHAHRAEAGITWQRRTRRCWWRDSPNWPPRWEPGKEPGIRWWRCTGCSPTLRQGGCWCSTMRPALRRWRR